MPALLHGIRARAQGGALRGWERAAILVPLALQGAGLYPELFGAQGLRFGFAQALSVMMFLAVLLCWLEGFFYPIDALYAFVLAAGAICAPLPAFFAGRLSPDATSFEFRLHLVAGMLAYSLFTVAMLHALLISRLENRLHALRLRQHHRRQRDEVVQPLAPRRLRRPGGETIDDRQRERAQVADVAQIALDPRHAR